MEGEEKVGKLRNTRAFELDLLRGFAIFMLVLHHFAYDLRFIFNYKVFAFIGSECDWFWAFVHPFFIFIFVGISGVCCQFSRNNFKRSLKLLGVALAFSAVTIIADRMYGLECAVYFNVLHLLTVATFLFAVFDHVEQKKTGSRESRGGDMILFTIVMVFIWLLQAIRFYHEKIKCGWVAILGIDAHPDYAFAVGDEMGLIPWIGVFFLGVLIGRHVYKKKETLFPNTPKPVKAVSTPFEWIGRHSLLVYIVHQPVVLGILYLLRYVGVLK